MHFSGEDRLFQQFKQWTQDRRSLLKIKSDCNSRYTQLLTMITSAIEDQDGEAGRVEYLHVCALYVLRGYS